MKRTFSLFLLIFLAGSISIAPAQVKKICMSAEHDSLLRAMHPERGSIEDFEMSLAAWKKSKPSLAKRNLSDIYRIPVVVHIIHSGGTIGSGDNISDAQILSQIQVLNEDFRRKPGTRGFSTYPQSADTKIEFELAKRSPSGAATNGITRHDAALFGFPPFDKSLIESTIKPGTIWDPNQYFNIWVMQASGLYGYAQFPEASGLQGFTCYGYGTFVFGASTDGVVMSPDAFGTIDLGPFVLDAGKTFGKVTIHEIGHWLGLRHIWGDDVCGNDYCEDTPIAYQYNWGTFTHPKSNTCGTADEMFENHMDYTDDDQKNTFTLEQMVRMRSVLENSPRRKELLSSPALLPPHSNDVSISALISPDGDFCTGATITPEIILRNMGSDSLHSAGISYAIDGGAVQTMTRPTSVGYLQFDTVTLTPISVAAGNHTIKVWTTTSNGLVDPASFLDTFETAFLVTPGLTVPAEEIFESAVFPSKNWKVNNVGNDCFTWRSQSLAKGPLGVPTKAMTVNFFNYTTIAGQKDELITPIYDLSAQTFGSLYFHFSHARKVFSNNSSLSVFASTNCGDTWTQTPVFTLSGSNLITTTILYPSDDFLPTSSTDWRIQNINLSAFLGNKVRFKFVTTNNGGNNLYLDNIGITNSPDNIPTITGFSPGSGVQGTTVTITGTNLSNPSFVAFNGLTATVTSSTSTQITTKVPTNATTGIITVIKPFGSASTATEFVVLNPPSIFSFSPLSGPVGEIVTLYGTDFNNITSVKLNGTACVFTLLNSTSLTFPVPAGSTTGKIQIQNSLGTSTSISDFLVGNFSIMDNSSLTTCNNVILDPGGFSNYGEDLNITQTIFPATAGSKVSVSFSSFDTETTYDYLNIYDGTSVGSNLIATLSGNTYSTPFSYTASNSQGALTFQFVSDGFGSGAGWLATVSCFVPAPPTISGFSPSVGLRGSNITITGTNFLGVNSVKINNVSASSFVTNSLNQITMKVPANATSGKITVTTNLGTAQSADTLIIDTTFLSYCFPVNPPCNGDFISNVRIINTPLNNTTTCTNTDNNAYSIFPAVGNTTASLKKGRNYVAQVTSSNDQVAFWLDLNRNGTFEDTEYYLISTIFSTGPVSLSFQIPYDADTGMVGMRFRSRSAFFSSQDACAAFGSGETEDYYVRIQENTEPYIQNFTPGYGLSGTTVLLKGGNFLGITSVKFNGTPATFNILSADSIRTFVPIGATTGRISVSSPLGSDTSSRDFFVGAKPPPKVLILYTSSSTTDPYFNDVKSKIENTGVFYQVDGYNGYNGTPTLSQLQDYSAVLAFSTSSWLNPVSLGNILTQYLQSGGGVVSGMFNHASASSGNRIQGGFIPYELIPYSTSSLSGTTQSIGTRHVPSHPLLAEVNTFNGGSSYRPSSFTINPGAIRIADWTDGVPLIVVKEYLSPTLSRKVDLGMWPTSSDGYPGGGWSSSTDGAKILRNALLWVMRADSIPFIKGFDPGIGAANSQVSVYGKNFTNHSSVKFNGIPVTDFVSSNDSVIVVKVPVGATTGKINVNTPKGSAFSKNDFYVGTELAIYDGEVQTCTGKVTDTGGSSGLYQNNETKTLTIHPATTGKYVRLTFSKFRTEACCDKLNVYNGPTVNNQLIGTYSGNALPPVITSTYATGELTLRFTSNVSVQDSGFVAAISCYNPPGPQILSFSPTFGSPGTFVTITGTDFLNPTEVLFNGTSTSNFTVISSTKITVYVPAGATTGKITVVSNSGTGISAANFVVTDPNFFCTPGHQSCTGQGYISNVSIIGTSLNNNSGCSNQNAPGYTYYPPAGSTTCQLSAGSSFTLSVTTAVQSQIISAWLDFDRDSIFESGEWSQVTVSSVIGSPGTVQINLPQNIATGPMLVRIRSRNAGNQNGPGDACTAFASGEAEDYSVTVVPDIYPRIYRFTPPKGPIGTQVLITGKLLQNTSSVLFNQAAASFTQLNDTTLSAIVPPTATTGIISATTPLGVAASITPFVVQKTGRPGILLLHSTTGTDNLAPDLKTRLQNSYPFEGIDIINASTTTPTLDQLRQYDAILMWNYSNWMDRVTLGTNLASYINEGGRVVGAVYATAGVTGSNPGGNYSDFELIPFGPSTYSSGMLMASPLIPSHPLLKDVQTFKGGSTGSRPVATIIAANATRVSNWTSGSPLIVVSDSIGNQKVRKADLGFFPVSSTMNSSGWDASTDGIKILRNALLWVTNNESYLDSVIEIKSFSPGSGTAGTNVKLKGVRFTGVNALSFNGKAAAYSVESDSVINTSVPLLATTGRIQVVKNQVDAISKMDFHVGDTIRMQNNTFSVCSGLVSSSLFGFQNGGYNNNEFNTLVLYPSTTGNRVRISFLNFQTESGFDFLRIYNGTNSSASLLGSFSGSNLPTSVLATNSDGALTLVFSSSSSTVNAGFLAAISCFNPNSPAITSVSPGLGGIGASVTIFGTNLLSATSVQFNGTPSVILTNTATSITTTVPAGATNGYITVTNSLGTGQSPLIFQICPEFTTVPTSLDTASRCGSGTITCTASGAPGTSTYRWYSSTSSTSFLSQGATYSNTLTSTNIYYVGFYNTTTGCQGARKPVVFKVNTIPNSGFSGLLTNYCQNAAPSNLVPLTPGGVFSGIGVVGNQFYPQQSGTISVTYNVSLPPCSSQTVRTTNVAPTPVASFAANGATLSSTTPGTGLFYQWVLNGTKIPSATSSFYTVLTNGAYQLIARIGNCSDTSEVQIITGSREEISNSEHVELFPNPFRDWVHLKARDAFNKQFDLLVTNSLGQEMQVAVDKIDPNEIRLNLEGKPAGIYFVKLRFDTHQKIFAITKE
ncbi:MAG TPA: IPT/TIG domain-containing protein [Catalimonadaceae bacterium]|nr:IPT/TIG domain-containing protein [Catalimonadaceae bacterium]